MVFDFLDIKETRIHYQVLGHGYPLVFIHAGIANLSMWDDQMVAFYEQYRVIRYDIRGWGKSAEPPGEYSDHQDLRSLLAGLGESEAVLIGSSFGASVAINMALVYPEMVKALVLAGPGLDGYEFANAGFEEEITALRMAYDKGDKALAAEYAARIWFDGHGRSHQEVDGPLRERALAMIRHTFDLPDGDGSRQSPEPATIRRLETINAPSLILLGEFDQPDIFEVARILMANLPNARQAVIEGCAHLPNMERPETFNRLTMNFLKEQGL